MSLSNPNFLQGSISTDRPATQLSLVKQPGGSSVLNPGFYRVALGPMNAEIGTIQLLCARATGTGAFKVHDVEINNVSQGLVIDTYPAGSWAFSDQLSINLPARATVDAIVEVMNNTHLLGITVCTLL